MCLGQGRHQIGTTIGSSGCVSAQSLKSLLTGCLVERVQTADTNPVSLCLLSLSPTHPHTLTSTSEWIHPVLLGVDVHSCVMSALLLAVDGQRYHLSALFFKWNHPNPSGLTVTALRNTHLSRTCGSSQLWTDMVHDLSVLTVKLKLCRRFWAK